jgi:hypothetical protein
MSATVPRAAVRVICAFACAAALLAVCAAGASAACGQRTTASPSDWAGGGPPPLVIGDSVLYDVVPALARLGFQSDAMVCRQMTQGIALLQQRAGNLPQLVVLALGTNGTVTAANIDQVMQILGPHRLLAMVTPHNGVVPADNGIILAAQRAHRSQMIVLDWNAISAGHPGWFAPDGIHLGGAAAIDAFAAMIATLLPYAAQPPCAT